MGTESFNALRRIAGTALLLLFGLCYCAGAGAQTTPSAVVTGPVTGVATHPATWGDVWETAISSEGDLVVLDFQNGALYEFPANGGAMITLAGPGLLASGGWTNMGVAIDPWNNLWVGQNWNANLLRVPYDPVNHTWNLSGPNATIYTWQTFNNMGVYSPNWFQAGAIAISPNVTNGTATIVVSAENVPAIYSYSIDSNGNFSNPNIIINSMQARAKSLAMDSAGNIYFIEDGGASGVLRIPAGTVGLATESGLTRVDPNISNPGGVAVDAAGNVYMGDNNGGVYLVPNENGMPNPADAMMLSTAPAEANVDFDTARGIMYIPTTPGGSGGWNGINDIAAITLNNVNLGAVAVGSQGTAATVNYAFSTSVTPSQFAIEESGSTTPDFAVASGGTCATGTAYAAQGTCSVNVTLSPHAAGSLSGKLLMLDAQNNILASIGLYGVGQAPAIAATPALESTIGSNFVTPGEVATDAMGNVYVADAGLGQVLMYAPGSSASVSIGTGLKAPTGVAVDGAGDVYIADSGNVYEVPNTPSGLNAAGQMTLKTGLSTGATLAVDDLNHLYIADTSNSRVVELGNPGGSFGYSSQMETDLTTGFTAPTAVAVDSSDNLYVADSGNLIEVQPSSGTQSTLLTGLGTIAGLAVDPSGAVYASMAGGTVRIPSIGGTLNQGSQTMEATSVTQPAGLALDKSGNLYIADGVGENIHMVSVDSALNFGLQSSSTTLADNLLNIGNAPLMVNSFTSTDAEDFSAEGCSSSVDSGSSCSASVTLNPGPGVQGSISSVISIQSNAANSPVDIDASATGAALAGSNTAIAVSSSANVLSIPVTVTVTPASGTGVPTGSVVVSVDGGNSTTGTLSGGTVTVTFSAITAGSHTFSAQYVGDRTYGSSTASTTGTVAKGTVTFQIPEPPTYSLDIQDQDEPYDGSLESYYTNYVVSVSGAPGLPATGLVDFMQGSDSLCPDVDSPTEGIGDPLGASTPGQVIFLPGCLPITNNSSSPNELTQQTITSIVYAGDANYLPATATTTTAGNPMIFQLLRQPSVSISPSPGTLTISSGTGSATLSVASVLGYGVSTNGNYPSSTSTLNLNNYTLPVTFACQGLPAYATCSFSGGNYTDLNGVLHTDEFVIDTDPSRPVSVTVTINTNISTGAVASNGPHAIPGSFVAVYGLGLFGLLLGGGRKWRKSRILGVICLLVLSGAFLGMTACSTSSIATSNSTTTPTGSYAVSITAQQVGSIVVTGSNGLPETVYGSENQMSLPYTLNVTVK